MPRKRHPFDRAGCARTRTLVSRFLLVLFVAVGCPGFISALDRAPFILTVTPGAQIPMGPLNTDGSPIYTTGGSVAIGGEYVIPAWPALSIEGLVAYTFAPTVAQTSLSLITVGVSPTFTLSPMNRIEVQICPAAGYSLGFYRSISTGESKIGGTPYLGAEVRALYSISRAFALGVGASYQYHVGLYHGVGVHVGGSYRLGLGGGRAKAEFLGVEFEPVFPVFSKYYDDHPVGRLTVKNAERGVIRNVTVSFFVPQYMLKQRECASLPAMQPGEEAAVELHALFTDDILSITEDTKAEARIIVEYTYLDAPVRGETDVTLRVYNRNAMTWDDDRKAAAFVTARDPALLSTAKMVVGEVRDRGISPVSAKLREAMGLFQSLDVAGVRYVPDPTGSFLDRHEQRMAIDYLQFPTQTLAYRAGDCDDLSILYAALLESTGTSAAFVTVPGHIFVAFDLGVDPDEARRTFSRPEDLIVRDGRTWVPVEITMVREGFLAAWREGARELRAAEASGTAKVLPVREALAVYEPVPFSGLGIAVEPLQKDRLVRAYDAEFAKFVEAEIRDQAAALRQEIARSGGNPKASNKLGVLYARYGLYDRAEPEFQQAAKTNFVPAIVNLGNLWLLRGDAPRSLSFFELASTREPNNVAALAGLARANYEMENMGSVRALMQRITALDAKAAEKLSYLVSRGDEGARAAEAARGDVLWDEGR
jgi:tetratricopeptide (TPR) repeat protein